MFRRWINVVLLAAVCLPACLGGGGGAAAPLKELAQGQRLFIANCARCHGVKGLGEMGPSLARPQLPRAPDLATLLSVIDLGLPGTAMPRALWLTSEERLLLATYVLSLGRSAGPPPPGDPRRGRLLFETRGGCLACHTVHGSGGTVGPDLTEVGLRRAPEYLRRALLRPGEEKSAGGDGFAEFVPVRLATADGEEVTGVRLNEDDFTLQIRDPAGRLRTFQIAGLKTLTKMLNGSLMPSFAGAFSAGELDDLIAYLASLGGTP